MVWIYWIISLTIVTYFSAYVVRRFPELGFAALTGMYVLYMAASQIFASRIVIFDLIVYKFVAPSAIFIYPFVSQAIDMINEVYGRKKTHIAIFIAFVSQVLLIVFVLMMNSLTPAPFFKYESAWRALFTLSIRITIASWISFLICQNVDALVFDKLKQKFEKQVWLRSVASDVLDLTLDSVIFVTLAFWGTMPILPLIIGQMVSKNVIGFLDTPWFLWYKRLITSAELEKNLVAK